MTQPASVLSESQLRTLAADVARLIEEEFAPHGCDIAPRWRGGQMVLKPGNEAQDKEIPIELFFKKLLTVRDALRLIEQKISACEGMSAEDKASVQSYVSRAFGSLTSFNVLFKNDDDRFVGQGRLKETTEEKIARKTTLPRSPLNEF
jgi:hypothetical protein